MEGTNKTHENGEAMGLVGVRLTDQLGLWKGALCIACSEPFAEQPVDRCQDAERCYCMERKFMELSRLCWYGWHRPELIVRGSPHEQECR